MSTKEFFTDLQKDSIIACIKDAERSTSGEIQVHVEESCKKDPMLRAKDVFEKLRMHKTELRNGVLFYLATQDKKFAILGDKGINDKVPPTFWDEIKLTMQEEFKEGRFTEGLCTGILAAGEQLRTNFPYNKSTDRNELSDDISFGN